MASGRRCTIVLSVLLWLVPCAVTAQAGSLPQALNLEQAGKCGDAFPLYRQALGEGDVAGALLGLERCASELGRGDTLLVVLDSVLRLRPRDPVARDAQLRTLTSAERFDAASAAFSQWTAAAPGDAAPYRQYAHLLLQAGRPAAADTVLTAATLALGGTREIAAELAEMRATLGMWDASARSWREAMVSLPYLEQAAVYVLSQAPPAARDSVRTVLRGPPVEIHVRRILAGLELRWRSASEAWRALSVLPASDSAVAAWLEFAADASQQDAWLAARDAYVAVLDHGAPGDKLVVNAATAALRGGEPASAVEILDAHPTTADSSVATRMVLLRVRALSDMGRPTMADSLLGANASVLDSASRDEAIRAVAWGWIRSGDVEQARTTLARSASSAGPDDELASWFALYEGDLKTARSGLRHFDETSRDAVLAMALLTRTRADTSVNAGQAFLALARGDTARAAAAFEATAATLTDAAPFMLGVAARLYRSTPDSLRSPGIWKMLIEQYAQAPEAAEADLEWARTLRRHGDNADAVTRLEHLILTYPQSALVPQARRELELAKGAIPPLR